MPHKHKHKKKNREDDFEDLNDDQEEEQNEERQVDDDEEVEDYDEEVRHKRKGKKHKKHKHKKKKRDEIPPEEEWGEDDDDEVQQNSVNSDYNIIKATETTSPIPDDLDDAVKNNWTNAPLNGIEEGPMSPNTKRRSIAFNQMKYNVEELNADFELTPWVPPSIQLAKEYHAENVLKGGKASICAVDMCNVQDCGNGVPLFFLFMKTYTIAFIVMSLLAAPSMLITTNSDRIEYSDRDSLGLYRFTIGNLGFAADNPRYSTLTACSSSSPANSTCITINGQAITLEDAGVLITWFELAQNLVFFIAYLYLRHMGNKLIFSAAGRDCNIGDYAVWVKDIQDDTTIEKLISHFSNLYQLGATDWRKRPPLSGAQSVRNVSNTEVDVHFNTWVAEATVYKKLGAYIRAFKKETKCIESLKRARAFMKMYKEDTCHAEGPNPRKYSKWEDKMLRLGSELDRLTEHLMHYRKHHGSNKQLAGSSGASPTRRGSLSEQLEADAHCAFIVFNYSESRARCLEDYQGYSKFPWNLCYPAEMKFRGTRVTVEAAPEPDEIIWENLEITPSKKFCSRVFSFIVTFIFIVIGFAIILATAGVRNTVAKMTPHLSMCKSEIPSLYEQAYDWGSKKPVLVRPSVSGDSKMLPRSQLDAKCNTALPSSFYAYYADNGELLKPIGTYDIDACYTQKMSTSQKLYPVNGPCPQYNQSTFCPCFSTISSRRCETLGCKTKSSVDFCGSFESNALAGCYCSSRVTSVVLEVLMNPGGAQSVYEAEEQCLSFFKTYSASLAATYGAAVSTAVINYILNILIVYFTKREYYDTTDVETGSIVKKVFFVTYLNIAVVVLLAFGYLKNGGKFTELTNILNGNFIDFTPGWYGQVGTFLVINYIANTISPWLENLPKFFVLRPIQLWFLLPKIEKMKSHKIAMQADCNRLFTGRAFDYTLHYAQLLALLFVGMTFASGIPIFMPLLAATFALYHFFNKMLILRRYKKPPHMGVGIHQIIMVVLPYAGFVRLAVGMWMYGNNDVIKSTLANIASIPGFSSTGQSDPRVYYNEYLAAHQGDSSITFIIISKAVRANVLPLIILLAILLVVKVIQKIVQYLPLYYIIENIGFLYIGIKRCIGKSDEYVGKVDADGYVQPVDLIKLKHPLRNEMAPYTDAYYKYIEPRKDDVKTMKNYLMCDCRGQFTLSPTDIEYGWELVEQDGWYLKVKKWKTDVYEGNISHEAGSSKLTFEVVAEDGCYSYALDRIPAYQVAMKGLRDNLDDYKYDKANNMTKVDEQDNIVEKFLREKKEREKLKHNKSGSHDKLPDGSYREKPQTAGGAGSSHRVIPDDAHERYANATAAAKKATTHRAEDEDDHIYEVARHKRRNKRKTDDDEDDNNGDDDEQEEYEEKPAKRRNNNRDNRRKKYNDDDDDADDDEYNKGTSGLV